MSEPEFGDLLGETIETSDDESSALITKLDKARTSAAFWKGRCEGLELALAHAGEVRAEALRGIREGYAEAIRQLREDRELTLAYLKDRLNRLEVPAAGRPGSGNEEVG